MIWEIGSLLKHVVLPPMGIAWLALLAWLLLRKRPRAARWLLGMALLLGYLASTPWTSEVLMRRFVEDHAPPAALPPQAIVVLGGGRSLAFDTQGQVLEAFASGSTLERMLTGARLQKQTGLPLLVTGGKPDGYDPAEGRVMGESLRRDFGVPVRWVEAASRNTVENARFSAPLLREASVRSIYLVTNGYHMRRARYLFEAQGFAVTPVAALSPMSPDGRVPAQGPKPFSMRDLVPTINDVQRTFIACNEIAGLVYARLSMR